MRRTTNQQRHSELFEAEQDLRFERREWQIERLMWLVMATLVAAGTLGLLGGPGVLSHARATRESLTIEYERLLRSGSHAEIVVSLTPAARGDTVRLWLGGELTELGTADVMPAPIRWTSAGDRLALDLAVDPAHAPHRVTLRFNPQRVGLQRAQIGVEGGPTLDFSQFVYP